MNDELVCSLVKGGGCFKTRDVGAVAEFGHGKAADHASQRERTLLEPVRELSGRCIALQGTDKQTI